MKKLFSLFVVLISLVALGSCAPKADKAKTKMDKAGYVSVDTKSFIGTVEESNVENAFAFVKGDNALSAVANALAGKADYVVAIYYKTTDAAKNAYEEYKKDKEKDKIVVKKSGKCLYYGTEQGLKDFA